MHLGSEHTLLAGLTCAPYVASGAFRGATPTEIHPVLVYVIIICSLQKLMNRSLYKSLFYYCFLASIGGNSSAGAQYYTWDILCVIHTNSESFLRDVNMILS